MRILLLIITFTLLGMGISKTVLAIDPFDPGGIYNPININIVPTKSQQNQQKAFELQSLYGSTAYWSCRGSSSYCDSDDPNFEGLCLIYVEDCLKRRTDFNSHLPIQLTCSDGYVLQNSSCVTGCSVKYPNSYWTGEVNNGSYICDCYDGYAWNNDRTQCVSMPTCLSDQTLYNGQCISNNDYCIKEHGVESYWNGNDCVCKKDWVFGNGDWAGVCVLLDAFCRAEYGNNSIGIDNLSSKTCGCNQGYEWNSSVTECIPKQLKCTAEQFLEDGKCINYHDGCRRSYGDHSLWTGEFEDGKYICSCMDKYVWNEGGTQCILDKEPKEALSIEESSNVSFNNDLTKRMLGNILLQVESYGEAWYVEPNSSKRYYMKDGATAYQMMRSFGLGITDSDLSKIPSVDDTDAVKNAASICSTNQTADRLKGKILLQVQQHGEAYYVYPKNCRMIYMKDGDSAYQIMRYLGLGITNENLEKIPSSE